MIEHTELAPGYPVCRLINGGWQLSAGHRAETLDREAALRDLRRLVDSGLTTFDGADIYVGVEVLLGQLRRELRRVDPDAQNLQLHTKYVPDLARLSKLTRQDVEQAIDRSLHRLGVERLDLVQFAWWDYEVPRYVEIATWLAELQKEGKIHLLGTTNFDVPRLREVVEAGVPIAANQVQYSLLDRRPENHMVAFCREHDIQMLGYGTLAGGFVSQSWIGRPEPVGPLDNRSLVKYKLIIDEFGGWPLFQDLLQVLNAIADRHAVSMANVAVRWVLDRSQVAAVLIGARNAEHLEDNLRIFSLCLDDEDRERLTDIGRRAVGPLGEPFELERLPGGRHAAILKTDLNRESTD